jgi:hypothetical protein
MKIHTGTIRGCSRCREEFRGRYVPVELANELTELIRDLWQSSPTVPYQSEIAQRVAAALRTT